MPSPFEIALRLDGVVPRSLIGRVGSMMMKRRGDQRRFATDAQGNWLNRQGDMCLVSPDIHTASLGQLRDMVATTWLRFYTPQQGDAIVDVGAGIGEETVVFSELVGASGRVVAIEAHPGTFRCLESSVRQSGLANVEPIHAAIADSDGSLTITDSAEHLGNSVVQGGTGIAVEAMTLDTLAARLGLERIALIKMNIEGAERLAVRGMERTARICDHIVISCHDFLADRGGDAALRTKSDVIAALRDHGFTVQNPADRQHDWLNDFVYATKA